MAMTYEWVFICGAAPLNGQGCGAVIKIKTDQGYFPSGFIKCPVCHRYASFQRKE